jgi:hypothetical protein
LIQRLTAVGEGARALEIREALLQVIKEIDGEVYDLTLNDLAIEVSA